MPDTLPYPTLARIAPSDLKAKVREIALRDVGFVYVPPMIGGAADTCLYQHNGNPSCLIGRGMHELGVPLSELAEMDAYADGSSQSYPAAYARALGADLVEVMRDFDVQWLGKVQDLQDDGLTYGDCVATADENETYRKEEEL